MQSSKTGDQAYSDTSSCGECFFIIHGSSCYSKKSFVLFASQIEEREIFEDVKLMNEIMFDSYITSSKSDFELQDLIKILREMGLFCTYNTEWEKLDRYHGHMNPSNIIMTYTTEEENWIVNQMQLVDQAFRSVPLGMDLINEFMMHCLGVPLSRTYMPAVLSVMLERIRRVLNIHPNFEEMSVSSQRTILRANSGLGLALYVARNESLNGMEQLLDGMGELDEEMWNFHYASIFDTPDKFTKVSMTDLQLFSVDDSRLFGNFLSETLFLVRNKDLFRINLLVAMTAPCGDDDSFKALSNLHYKYKMILKRRIRWKSDWTESTAQSEDPNFPIDKILSGYENLKRLARLNEKVMNG